MEITQVKSSIGVMLLVVASLAIATPAHAAATASGLELQCRMQQIRGFERSISETVWCYGYMSAVLDSVETDSSLVIVKKYTLGDAVDSLLRYVPQHNGAEPARKAIVNALIHDGYLKRIQPK